jgi:hypothetical protein
MRVGERIELTPWSLAILFQCLDGLGAIPTRPRRKKTGGPCAMQQTEGFAWARNMLLCQRFSM